MLPQVFWPKAATVGSFAASIAVETPDLETSSTVGGLLVVVVNTSEHRPFAALSTRIKGTSVAFVPLLESS